MRRYYHPAREEISLESVLYALSDPARLSIVMSLAGGQERSCGDFSSHQPKSTTSHHLRVLREAGVTRTRVQSTSAFISLRRDDLEARFPGLLGSIIAANRAGASPGAQTGAKPASGKVTSRGRGTLRQGARAARSPSGGH